MTRLGSVACVLLLAGLGVAQPPVDLPPPPFTPGTPMTPPPLPPVHTAAPGAPATAHGAGHEAVHAEGVHAEGGGKSCCGLVLFDGEFFAWAPRRRAGQDYALVGTNTNVGPVGTVRTVDGDYDVGFRLGGGYRFGKDGLDVMARYTYWHGQREDAVSAVPGGAVFTTLTNPGVVTAVNRASGNDVANLNIFDFEVGQAFHYGENVKGRVFIGPRFANVDQTFTATYTGRQVASSVVRRQSTFDGGGLRVGGEATFEIVQGFGFLVRGSAGMMTGRFRTNLNEVSNNTVVMDATERFNKVVPHADLGIGITYTWGVMKLAVGYEFLNFFGLVDTFDFADDVATGKMTRRTGDFGLDGIFARCEFTF